MKKNGKENAHTMNTNEGAIRHAAPKASRGRRCPFFIAIVLFCGVLVAISFIAAPALAEESSEAGGLEWVFAEISEATAPPEPLVPQAGWAYQNDSIRIEIAEHQTRNSVYFTVELWLSDIHQLQSAFSSNQFDSATETVEDIAVRHDAILAINGDFATFNNGGIIIRNGTLYRSNKSTRQLLTIGSNGDFHALVNPPEDSKNAAQRFMEQGVWQTCVFGPLLVENGQPVEMPKKFFIKPTAHEPRTAIAQIGPLHYLIIIADGRQGGYSRGITLEELRDLFILYGVKTAFNLDGGGSTTLYFDGKVLNRPANGNARRVPDIFFVAR